VLVQHVEIDKLLRTRPSDERHCAIGHVIAITLLSISFRRWLRKPDELRTFHDAFITRTGQR